MDDRVHRIDGLISRGLLLRSKVSFDCDITQHFKSQYSILSPMIDKSRVCVISSLNKATSRSLRRARQAYTTREFVSIFTLSTLSSFEDLLALT